MKKIFLKTGAGTYPIDPAIAEKYGLKAGVEAPFSSGRLVDQYGYGKHDSRPEAESLEGSRGELVNDGIAELDNALTLSQSEIIDFAQGTDSNPNG